MNSRERWKVPAPWPARSWGQGSATSYDTGVTDERRARFDTEALVHLGAVYGAAYRLTRDADRARDLSQDAMLRAWRAFDTYTPGTNARAWLLRIVYSIFVNDYHHDRRAPATQSIEALEMQHGFEPVSPSAPVPDPWQPEGWTEPVVREALDALPDDFRAAVLLVDVEELSYEEAAVVMDCAVGTVRSRLFRARRLLGASLRAWALAQRRVTTKSEAP